MLPEQLKKEKKKALILRLPWSRISSGIIVSRKSRLLNLAFENFIAWASNMYFFVLQIHQLSVSIAEFYEYGFWSQLVKSESWLLWLAVSPWTSSFTSLCLSFLIIIGIVTQHCCEYETYEDYLEKWTAHSKLRMFHGTNSYIRLHLCTYARNSKDLGMLVNITNKNHCPCGSYIL